MSRGGSGWRVGGSGQGGRSHADGKSADRDRQGDDSQYLEEAGWSEPSSRSSYPSDGSAADGRYYGDSRGGYGGADYRGDGYGQDYGQGGHGGGFDRRDRDPYDQGAGHDWYGQPPTSRPSAGTGPGYGYAPNEYGHDGYGPGPYGREGYGREGQDGYGRGDQAGYGWQEGYQHEGYGPSGSHREPHRPGRASAPASP